MSSDESITTKAWSVVSSYENKCLDESMMRQIYPMFICINYTFYIILPKMS